MKEFNYNKIMRANKKIFPSLGGLTKKYIRKEEWLKRIIIFLADKLAEIEEFEKLKINQKNYIRRIQEDLKKISGYKKKKVMEFYFEVLEILNKF